MPSSVASIAAWQKRVGELLPSLSRSQAEALGLLSGQPQITPSCSPAHYGTIEVL